MLPSDGAMAERQKAGKSLTRPEIGVLLAYAKIALHDDLLRDDALNDPEFAGELVNYFPTAMHDGGYTSDVETHRLRREIMATGIANELINRGGPTYATRVAGFTNATPPTIARAYLVVREAFGLTKLNDAIDAIDGSVPGRVQLDLYRALRDLVIAKTVWFVRNVTLENGVVPTASAYSKSITALAASLDSVLPDGHRARLMRRAAEFAEHRVPIELAARIARLEALADAPDIDLVATRADRPFLDAAATYFRIAESLEINKIRAMGRALEANSYFDRIALDRALATLEAAHRQIAVLILQAGTGASIEGWLSKSSQSMARALRDIKAADGDSEPTVSQVSVAASLLSDLARSWARTPQTLTAGGPLWGDGA